MAGALGGGGGVVYPRHPLLLPADKHPLGRRRGCDVLGVRVAVTAAVVLLLLMSVVGVWPSDTWHTSNTL